MTEAQLLDGQAFNRLVLENDLAGKTWEQNGYIYAGFRGQNGYELYRTYGPKWQWLYQARRVLTSPVGGGVLVMRISVPTGTVMRLVQLHAIGPLTNNALSIYLVDEDANNTSVLGLVSAATAVLNLPSVGANAATTANNMNTQGLLIGPGNYIRVAAAASAVTETLTLHVQLLSPTKTEPTWDTTGAVAGATLAASTISAANTWQEVLLP